MRRILRATVVVFEMTTGLILGIIFYGFFLLPVAMFHLTLSLIGATYLYAKHSQLSMTQAFVVTSVDYWGCYEFGGRKEMPLYWEWVGVKDFDRDDYEQVKQLLEGK